MCWTGKFSWMNIHMEIIQESKKAKNAENAVRRFLNTNDLSFDITSVEPFFELGHMIYLNGKLDSNIWSEGIYQLMLLASTFASSWEVSGDIETSFCMEIDQLKNNSVGIFQVILGVHKNNELLQKNIKTFYIVKNEFFLVR